MNSPHQRKRIIGYCFGSVTALSRGIWISFFAPNWAGASSLLFPDDPGGRLLPPKLYRFKEVGITFKAARPPLSAAQASITAWASSVSKKDIHIPHASLVTNLKQQSL